jgi:hypothetical protein
MDRAHSRLTIPCTLWKSGKPTALRGWSLSPTSHTGTTQPIFTCVGSNKYPTTEGPLTIQVHVGAQPAIATVDTGVGMSIIHYDLAKTFEKVSQKKYRLTAINGRPIHNFGFALVPLTVGQRLLKYPMLILKTTRCKVLLGYDFLESFEWVINIPSSTMTCNIIGTIPFANKRHDVLQSLPPELKAALHFDQSKPTMLVTNNAKPADTQSSVNPSATQTSLIGAVLSAPTAKNYMRVVTDTVLDLRSKMGVRVRPDTPLGCEAAVVDRNNQLYRHQRILCPNLLIDKQTSFVELINPTDTPLKLCAGTKLGTIAAYNEVPIPLFMTRESQSLPQDPKTDVDFLKLHVNPNLTQGTKSRL